MTFRTTFLEWSLLQFSELAVEFDGEPTQTRLHFAFLAFRQHTQAAIDARDRDRLKELFNMASCVLDSAYPEMRSLFHVVYIEHLAFHDTKKTKRSWAIEHLTPQLKAELAKSISGLPSE